MRRTPDGVSVIVSTYNNPRALAAVLAGLARQTFRDFEILVADDGSGAETAAALAAAAAHSPRPVRHVWHEDRGVRRNTILNRAVLRAQGEYLVFLDGDCLPPPQWLAAHVAGAERGWYVSGGKVLLSEALTQMVFAGRIPAEALHRFTPLWRQIAKRRRLVMSRIPLLRRALDFNRRERCGWVGEDSSTFAAHLRDIGGFDERFTLVWDDADVCERLKGAGVRGRSIRYRAPVLHLEHGRGYRGDDDLRNNLELFLANRAAGLVATRHGLALHAAGDGAPAAVSRSSAE